MAMVGVIQVGKADNKESAMKAAEKLGTQLLINKDRLPKYMSQVN